MRHAPLSPLRDRRARLLTALALLLGCNSPDASVPTGGDSLALERALLLARKPKAELGPAERAEIRRASRKLRAEERARRGNWGVELTRRLERASGTERLPVRVEFPLPYRRGSGPGGKLTRTEALAQRRTAFEQGVAALADKVGTLDVTTATFRGEAALSLSATVAALSALKHDPRISAIDTPVDPAHHRLRPSYSLQRQYSFPLNDGVNIFGLCNFSTSYGPQSCGQGVNVGVLEPSAITQQDLGAYFDGGWFVNRGGTPYQSPTGSPPQYAHHGALVAGMIRNSYGTDLVEVERGGARELGRLLFGYLTGDDVNQHRDMIGPYDWMTSEEDARIVNNSWVIGRHVHPIAEAEGWTYDRHFDIATATWPYTLNVMGAGNTGPYGDNGPNSDCRQESQASNPTPWTIEQCDRVGWWGHNALVVGGVLGGTPRYSWRNGPTGDEAPHVVATSDTMQLPWMKPYGGGGLCADGEPGTILCGTSFAAPSITSLAADLVSGFPNLSSYPEALKAIIMASATRWPVSGGGWPASDAEDHQAGVGLPNGVIAGRIAQNQANSPNGHRALAMWPEHLEGQQLTGQVQITSTVETRVHFYLTWVSDFSNYAPGVAYPADDIDLVVGSDTGYDGSYSYSRSTEHVVLPLPVGTTTFEYYADLYQRNSNPDSTIYLALAWTPEAE